VRVRVRARVCKCELLVLTVPSVCVSDVLVDSDVPGDTHHTLPPPRY